MKGYVMSDLEGDFDALAADAAKLYSEAPTIWGKARSAVQAWPFWVPVVVLAAVTGHCV